jgi:hypothetical protein
MTGEGGGGEAALFGLTRPLGGETDPVPAGGTTSREAAGFRGDQSRLMREWVKLNARLNVASIGNMNRAGQRP